MFDYPRDLVIETMPMKRRPDPPAPGCTIAISWYRARCIGEPPDCIYEILNIDKQRLAISRDWDQLCADCGWHFAEGIVPSLPSLTLDDVTEDPSDTIVISTAKIRIAIPRKLSAPLPERPKPPAVGEISQIAGYSITAKICKGANGDKPIYYLRSSVGEILSVAYDWDRWCHILGWYPLEGLEQGQAIPRETPVPKPARPNGPHVLNRHHYKSRDEIPEPWLYTGRGTPLGNPFVVVRDDPQIRSARADDPSNPEHRSPKDALTRYREWLWEQICRRNPLVLRELGKITASTNLVCSCVPRPCHANTIVKAWKWAKSHGAIEGYVRDESAVDPDWATEIEPDPTAASPTPAATPTSLPTITQAEPREPPKTLDLFGADL